MAGDEAAGTSTISIAQVDDSHTYPAEAAPAPAPAAATPAPRKSKPAAQVPVDEPSAAQTAEPASSGAEQVGPTDADVALAERLQMLLTAAGAPAVDLVILSHNDQGGGVVRLEAKDRHVVRTAASALLHSGDGREWKYLGDGPAGEEETLSAAYLSANPLA